MLPALLHASAFAVALFIQFTGGPLAGAWVFFHMAGCAALLYQGGYPKDKGIVWHACLLWLVILGSSAFLLTPVLGGAATLAVLASMPTLALCLRKEHLKPYFRCFLAVVTVYALAVVAQLFLNTQTTAFNYEGRHSWPVLDPNNAAAIVNTAFLPCVYMALNKSARWGVLCALFALALYVTGSKAGIGAAAVGTAVLVAAKCETDFTVFLGSIGLIQAVMIYFYRPELVLVIVNSLRDRFPIWEASWPMMFVRPFGGLGLGTFAHYYEQVRTESYTVGWHSHNDVLQIAIEAGIPAAVVFVFLFAAAGFTTCRANIVSGVVLLAVFLQSMVEFQFYTAAVGIPTGLALAYHMINRKGNAR